MSSKLISDLDETGEQGRGALRAPQVRAKLADMIKNGEFSVGDRLPTERDLMKRFDVSRSVVREAITDLANKGLIRTKPGCRPIVCRVDFDTAFGALNHFVAQLTTGNEKGIADLFETRMFIEGSLARWAALNARPEDIRRLQAALDANKAAIGRPGEFEETDMAFHHIFYEMQRNPIFPALHRAYTEWLYPYWRKIVTTPEIDMMNYCGHVATVEAVLARDGDAAEKAMRRHLAAAWEYVRPTFTFSAEVRAVPAPQ